MDKSLSQLPTLFRGVFWDAGFEYDAPAVVYFPVKTFSACGSNSGKIDRLVEDACLAMTFHPEDCRWWRRLTHWTSWEVKTFKNYGWSPGDFARRKLAWHVTLQVKWWREPGGQLAFKFTRRTETWGPPC